MRNPRLVADALTGLVDLLVPDVCHLCRRRGAADDAAAIPGRYARHLLAPVHTRLLDLVLTSHPFCARCLGRLREARRRGQIHDAAGSPLALVSPFYDDPVLLDIIHLIKFRRYRGLVAGLAAALAACIAAQLPPRADVLVPVPMDPGSRRRRGFNQAEDLARCLSPRLGLAVEVGWLVKRRRTRSQALTEAGLRLENVRDAFEVASSVPPGARVAIVDDLVTTGATALACAGSLEDAGATVVSVLAVGRAGARRRGFADLPGAFPHA